VITNVFPYGVVELNDERIGNTFLVSGQCLKYYHEGVPGIVRSRTWSSLMPRIHEAKREFSLSFDFSFLISLHFILSYLFPLHFLLIYSILFISLHCYSKLQFCFDCTFSTFYLFISIEFGIELLNFG